LIRNAAAVRRAGRSRRGGSPFAARWSVREPRSATAPNAAGPAAEAAPPKAAAVVSARRGSAPDGKPGRRARAPRDDPANPAGRAGRPPGPAGGDLRHGSPVGMASAVESGAGERRQSSANAQRVRRSRRGRAPRRPRRRLARGTDLFAAGP
jgi:hypothetical protein